MCDSICQATGKSTYTWDMQFVRSKQVVDVWLGRSTLFSLFYKLALSSTIYFFV